MTADQIIGKLGLVPLPGEGGYYRQTHKSAEALKDNCLPNNYKLPHSLSTCIYYLITPDTFSELHKLPGEEIWHFYLGDTAEQIQISPSGEIKQIRIGNNIQDGEQPQVLVPSNTWQGTRLVDGGKFALFGTTMSPGFEFPDYVAGDKDKLGKDFPAMQQEISKYFHN